jgi:hypothetical protein
VIPPAIQGIATFHYLLFLQMTDVKWTPMMMQTTVDHVVGPVKRPNPVKMASAVVRRQMTVTILAVSKIWSSVVTMGQVKQPAVSRLEMIGKIAGHVDGPVQERVSVMRACVCVP